MKGGLILSDKMKRISPMYNPISTIKSIEQKDVSEVIKIILYQSFMELNNLYNISGRRNSIKCIIKMLMEVLKKTYLNISSSISDYFDVNDFIFKNIVYFVIYNKYIYFIVDTLPGYPNLKNTIPSMLEALTSVCNIGSICKVIGKYNDLIEFLTIYRCKTFNKRHIVKNAISDVNNIIIINPDLEPMINIQTPSEEITKFITNYVRQLEYVIEFINIKVPNDIKSYATIVLRNIATYLTACLKQINSSNYQQILLLFMENQYFNIIKSLSIYFYLMDNYPNEGMKFSFMFQYFLKIKLYIKDIQMIKYVNEIYNNINLLTPALQVAIYKTSFNQKSRKSAFMKFITMRKNNQNAINNIRNSALTNVQQYGEIKNAKC